MEISQTAQLTAETDMPHLGAGEFWQLSPIGFAAELPELLACYSEFHVAQPPNQDTLGMLLIYTPIQNTRYERININHGATSGAAVSKPSSCDL